MAVLDVTQGNLTQSTIVSEDNIAPLSMYTKCRESLFCNEDADNTVMHNVVLRRVSEHRQH